MAVISSNERSLKSVFVGNIPYDATEEKLKDIFSEVGPVLSFRLVYDRETGKPKGYGFCEYKDQETALSAMRNLNGYELNGRTLRVDNAANERTREEIRNLQSSLTGSFESPYGPEIDPDKAPEAISKAVSSLPPEQMFDLAKTMKDCIQNNPNEARNMLIQNPQLAYALLQALVMMKIVDPQVAMSILHKTQVAQPFPETAPPPPQMQSGPPHWGSDNFGRLPQVPPMNNPNFDPRIRDINPGQNDPRIRTNPSIDPRIHQQSGMPRSSGGSNLPPIRLQSHHPLTNQDQEKAALIMQVLQLSDQQIAMLPPEQRQSIMVLKEQIARGTAQ